MATSPSEVLNSRAEGDVLIGTADRHLIELARVVEMQASALRHAIDVLLACHPHQFLTATEQELHALREQCVGMTFVMRGVPLNITERVRHTAVEQKSE